MYKIIINDNQYTSWDILNTDTQNMSILNVLNDILILGSSPMFIGTLCFKLDGNNISSPSVQGNKNVSEFKLLYFLGSSFMAC